VVAEGDRLFAIYSGYLRQQELQSVVIAESVDGGWTFGAPRRLGPIPDGPGTRLFRDPFVWREADQWFMLVGAASTDDHASALIYSSPDLLTWSSQGVFAQRSRHTVTGVDGQHIDTGSMWECPQLISFGDREALLVSAWSPADGTLHTIAMSGRRREMRLEGEVLSRVDLGSAFYAASVMRTPEGAIVWGWAREERDEAWCVEADWSGALTFPRSAALRPDGTLSLRPVEAMKALRAHRIAPDNSDPGLFTIPGAAFELEVTPRGLQVDIEMRFSDEESLALTLDPVNGRVTMDAASASTDPRAKGSRVIFDDPLDAGDSVRIFVDGSIVELFTGSGRSATMRAYPTSPPPWHVRVEGANATASAWMLAAKHPGPEWPDNHVHRERVPPTADPDITVDLYRA
jgi:beta-fructofuranosidase